MRERAKRAVEFLKRKAENRLTAVVRAIGGQGTKYPIWLLHFVEIMFDGAYYLQQYPDIEAYTGGPAKHFLQYGWREGRRPHALFDPVYYAQGAGVALSDAVMHFCHAGASTVSCHPYFDVSYYVKRYPQALQEGCHPLEHYLKVGAPLGYQPHPLFHPIWYSQTYLGNESCSASFTHFITRGNAQLYSPHPAFDVSYYVRQRPMAATDPFKHFLMERGAASASPHILFDVSYYVANCSEAAHRNPLVHYLTQGASDGFAPHQLIAETWYKKRYLQPSDPRSALEHYLTEGLDTDCNPHPLFDTKYYRSQTHEVIRDPLCHFLGTKNGPWLNPTPLFDTAHYMRQSPDVQPGENPLLHYLCHPERQPHPLFDPAIYQAALPANITESPLLHFLTVKSAGALPTHPLFDAIYYSENFMPPQERDLTPLEHYLRFGLQRGANPNPYFDAKFYAQKNPNVNFNAVCPLTHYMDLGAKLGLDPSPLFDTRYYSTQNPDVVAAGFNPLLHYLQYGRREGRRPNGMLDALYYAAPPAQRGETSPVAAIAPSWKDWDRLRQAHAEAMATPRGSEAVDVIVPVYAGFDETMLCLFHVIDSRSTCRTPFDCIVINDASPDPQLVRALRRLAKWKLIRLVNNPVNLGFVATVNRGMALNPDRNIVLLNSDTEVYGNWLDRLCTQANATDKVATVTPLSNNATICSYPTFAADNVEPLEISYADLDSMTSGVNAGINVPLPTAVGFCMFIQRACLAQVGFFDSETYGRGYAEENDFCLRASALGWTHILACDVFVYHRGSVSFHGEKAALLSKNLSILEAKYPHYPQEVAKFIGQDPVKEVRRRLDLHRLRCSVASSRGVVLMINHMRGGGTERHMLDLSAWLEQEGYGVCFLRPDIKNPGQLRINSAKNLNLPNLNCFDLSSGLEEAAWVLQALGVVLMHVHHFVGLREDAPDWLRLLASRLGIPFDFSVHDYTAICPRINMIDETGAYCGGGTTDRCENCIQQYSSSFGKVAMWRWRDRYGRMLESARNVYVPTHDVLNRMRSYYKNANYVLRSHPEVIVASSRAVPIVAHETLRVAVIGAVGPHKGSVLLQRCVRDANARGLPIEYVLFGYADIEELARMPRIEVTGAYEEEDVYDLLSTRPCDVALFAAVWPETYSYTLSVAINAGLYPVAFDLGAIAERLRELDWGTLLDLGMLDDARGVNDALLAIPRPVPRSPAYRVTRDLLYPGGIDDYYCYVPRSEGGKIYGVTEGVPDSARLHLRGAVSVEPFKHTESCEA